MPDSGDQLHFVQDDVSFKRELPGAHHEAAALHQKNRDKGVKGLRGNSPNTPNPMIEVLTAAVPEAMLEIQEPGEARRNVGKLGRTPVEDIGKTAYSDLICI